MVRKLVPMKIKIGKQTNGHYKYPDFNSLDSIRNSGMDWTVWIDSNGDGNGWHYDQTSDHNNNTEDSPFGQRWGVVVVPKQFVIEAVDVFPNECSVLTEEELEDFYDNKAHINEPEELFDKDILEGIKLKKDLGLTLTEDQLKALDPNDNTRGIRKNKRKKWKDFKEKADIEIEGI